MNKKELKSKVRSITIDTLNQVLEADKKLSDLNEKKGIYAETYFKQLQEEIKGKKETVISSATKEVDSIIDDYKKTVHQDFTLKGEELTEDAKLFNSGLKLNGKQLNELGKKYKDNHTMTQLINDYATENGMIIENPAATEAEELETADSLKGYFNSAIERPNFPEWSSEDYFNKVFGD